MRGNSLSCLSLPFLNDKIMNINHYAWLKLMLFKYTDKAYGFV